MSSMLKKAAVVSIPSVRQALARSNPILANALLAKRAYNSKGGVEVILTPITTKQTLNQILTTGQQQNMAIPGRQVDHHGITTICGHG